MRRLGTDKHTQDKVGAIRIWNMRKLRRVLDADADYRPGPRTEMSTIGTQFNSNSKLAKITNEVGRWPFDEWMAWRKEQRCKEETVITATAAYKTAKNARIRRERAALEADPSWKQPGIVLFNAPFQEVLPTLDPVDMIFTDPPYGRKYLSLYRDLNDFGAPLLNEGGSLITYFGHYALPEVIAAFQDLRFWWLLCSYQPRQRRKMDFSRVWIHWKPLLWLVKEGRGTGELVDDLVIVGKVPMKEIHDWEQGEDLPAYYIEHLTQPGDWILDPMMGSGTTGVAALKMGRRFIGIEKDTVAFAAAQERIKNALA